MAPCAVVECKPCGSPTPKSSLTSRSHGCAPSPPCTGKAAFHRNGRLGSPPPCLPPSTRKADGDHYHGDQRDHEQHPDAAVVTTPAVRRSDPVRRQDC